MEKPVEREEIYESEIEEVTQRGDGIAKIDGFVIFIPNAKQGEHVKFRITWVGKKYAIGAIVKT